ncbi:MAG: hypothetical protein CMP20_01540 [Rickettsiales bacterium]|nr:hypothetical protein [Rickettsiales bacterium]
MSASSSAKKRKRNDATSTDVENHAQAFMRSVWPEHAKTAKNTIKGFLRDQLLTTQFLIDLMGLPQDVANDEMLKKLHDPDYEVKGFANIDIRPWIKSSGAKGVMYAKLSSQIHQETPPEYVFDAKRFIDKQPTRTAFLLWPILFICKLADEEGLPGDVFGIDHQEVYTIMHDITGYKTLGSFDDVFDVHPKAYVKFIKDMFWLDMIQLGNFLGMPPASYQAFYEMDNRIRNNLKEMAKTFLNKPLNKISPKEREILRDFRLLN